LVILVNHDSMSDDVDPAAGSGGPTTFLFDGVGECDFQLAIPALDHALAIARRLCLLPASIQTCISGLQDSARWKVEGSVAPVSEGLEREIIDWFNDENRVRVILEEAPLDGHPRPRLPGRVYLGSRVCALYPSAPSLFILLLFGRADLGIS
jgi:hypothetical protein